VAGVYILYTGGTIGCVGTPLAPMSGPDFQSLVESMPGLGGNAVAGYPGLTYAIDWFDQPLDSSNMTPSDWITIAQRLVSVYSQFDGFVVLHGTDTMAFSASALSFFLPGLSKPIIFTGSQVPLAMTLNDALPNLVGAIVLAGTTAIPESLLYFDSLLLRGNRSAKVNANQFTAFASPNFPPLATVGTEITINSGLVLPPPDPSVSLSNPANLSALAAQLNTQTGSVTQFAVTVMTLYPGIGGSVANAVLNETSPPVRGVVIEAFGEGNGPSSSDFLAVLSDANAAGVVLMDNTQVLAGSVNIDAYATGSGLSQAGAVSAYDMTPEASLTKLVYLISLGTAPVTIRTMMQTSLAGEITTPETANLKSLPVA
jgi:L-asparaginase